MRGLPSVLAHPLLGQERVDLRTRERHRDQAVAERLNTERFAERDLSLGLAASDVGGDHVGPDTSRVHERHDGLARSGARCRRELGVGDHIAERGLACIGFVLGDVGGDRPDHLVRQRGRESVVTVDERSHVGIGSHTVLEVLLVVDRHDGHVARHRVEDRIDVGKHPTRVVGHRDRLTSNVEAGEPLVVVATDDQVDGVIKTEHDVVQRA